MQRSPANDTDRRWSTLQVSVVKTRSREAFQILTQEGIEAIIFKGVAAAANFPVEYPRAIGDVDVAVNSADFEIAKNILLTRKVESLRIDLHDEFRLLDTAPWQDVFDRCEFLEIDGVRVRVPAAEDHLRILATHWLINGGVYKHRLWDIYYLLEARRDNFDWDLCLNAVAPHRRRWILCVVGITSRYLGLSLAGMPIEEEAKRIPPWVVKCIEREWRLGGGIEPLLTSTRDLSLLLKQARRRLPPNRLRALVETEGDIDAPGRWRAQMRVLSRRAVPFARDGLRYFWNRVFPRDT